MIATRRAARRAPSPGGSNTASGDYSTVAGGYSNTASGDFQHCRRLGYTASGPIRLRQVLRAFANWSLVRIRAVIFVGALGFGSNVAQVRCSIMASRSITIRQRMDGGGTR